VGLRATYFQHIRDVPDWVWRDVVKNFSPTGDPLLADPSTGEFMLQMDSMLALQRLRDWMGPISILSGYRSPIYNARVGGAPKSMHKIIAFDIPFAKYYPKDLYRTALQVGFTGVGLYPTRGFIHLDLGDRREWYGKPEDKVEWEGL